MKSNTKEMDFSLKSNEDLQILLANELFMNINSPFAVELDAELERRQSLKTV